jgi:hypothetical protein
MDRTVTVEELSGTGRVHAKGKVALEGVDYKVGISQHVKDTSTLSGRSEVEGLESINGRISSAVPHDLIGEPIELEFEDGRCWQCFIQSSSGNLVNRAGIKLKP